MGNVTHYTTPEHFGLFKKSFTEWQEKLGLIDWQIYFVHEKMGCLAQCITNAQGCIATIKLSTEWDTTLEYITDDNIINSARHEALELLFARLISEAEYRYSTQENIDETTHMVIRTLEHVLPLRALSL